MELYLKDHVVVVCGGASGIGLATVSEFCAEGAKVVIVDRHPETLSIAAKLSDQFPGQVHGIIADLTDEAQAVEACRQVAAQLGRCDHVIFAVGIGSGKFGFPFWELTPADWPRVIEVNLLTAVHVAHAFRQPLLDSQGTLLMLSSVAGQIGSQTDPPYSASKAALINFMQCAAKDFAPYGVRVNALNPGMVQTPLNRSVYEAWAARQPEGEKLTYEIWAGRKIEQIVPLRRWQTPEDIAAMAVFLSSPKARNVTGQTINVDGGFVMHW
ncbi:SDR family NAD(P)-dependent oxidoreductase [Planctomicrobium piriforme]|uniref:NAD(P)-dependent dehydrogenase, short-chain alcohol dehydrogenase family n=1 Tax=Planctomicrobium piriforme TaxID=1576369 RepID=A0A1I3MQV9_9PLAN|nr:SDR family oxidoreductase [Planctomicrobium piriforme]SFI99332.1 NAD(P)-dependent dehydrogenase, short-chain alcohol dehydrogenase family [Planctomicrobium piriforme]